MPKLNGDYLGVPFRRSPGPAKIEDIARVESVLNAPLPADYKAFLAVTDGCFLGNEAAPGPDGVMQLDEWGFDTPDGMDYFSDVVLMSDMPSVGAESDDILMKLSAYDFHKRVPDRFVPVGETSYTGFVCLSLRKQDHGAVYTWNRKEYWPSEPYTPDMRELVRTANSFEQWWRSLRPLTDAELDSKPRRRRRHKGPRQFFDRVWRKVSSLFHVDPEVAIAIAAFAEETEDGMLAAGAMYYLVEIGEPAVPQLVRALQSENPSVRLNAVNTLGLIGPDAHRAASAIERLTNDPNEDVRNRAREALQKVSADS